MKFTHPLALTITGLLITFSVLEADCCSECCYPFDGFYLCVAAGPETERANSDIETNVNFLDPLTFQHLFSDSSRQTVDHIRPFGEIFGGWGKQWGESVYLGGRLGVNFSSFHVTQANSVTHNDPNGEFLSTLIDQVTTQIQRSAEFTFDFKPGIVFWNRSLFFGIIGGAFAREELKGASNFEYLNLLTGNSSTNSLSVDKSRASVGLRYGFGLETFLSQSLSLQMSYIYTHYPKLSVSGVADVTTDSGTIPGGYTASFSTKPSKQMFSLGVAWYF